MSSQIALILAILSEVAATSALKACNEFRNLWPSIIVVLGYGSAFYFPDGCAQDHADGRGVCRLVGDRHRADLLVGWVVYEQKLDAAALAGMGLIIAGVFVVNVLSTTTGH